MTLLRPAQSTDAGAVGAILSEFIDTTPWMPRIHTRAEDLAHAGALIARGWVTVAEVEGAVRGFAACDVAELNALYIAASARRRNLGSRLLIALQQNRPRLELWTFQANTGARRFYARHGFVEGQTTDGARNDEHLPDVRLTWEKDAA